MYRTLELPGKNPRKEAHAALDRAVLAAYGFDPKGDLLAQLLALNLEVAAREAAGEPVTAPGVPPSYGDPAPLVTDDCIRARDGAGGGLRCADPPYTTGRSPPPSAQPGRFVGGSAQPTSGRHPPDAAHPGRYVS